MFASEINILKALELWRSDTLNAFFEGVTIFGEDLLLIILMSLIYFVYDKNLARKIFFITSASLGTNCIIKNFVRMPRPFTRGISCVRPDTATGYAFPSGHTQNFTTWSLALSLHFKKKLWVVIAALFSVLMAFSRLYLGAHYPSDVLVGLLLGVLFSIGGSALYEKVQNKNTLYIAVAAIPLPFVVYFLIFVDAQYADFFKFYGVIVAFVCSVFFEVRLVKFDFKAPVWKRIVRALGGIVLAVAVKEVLKHLFACEDLHLTLVLALVRYFLLGFVCLALWPWIFKKIHL